jgi:hypothetical protein
MTAQQSQAVGPIEENASLLVLKEDDERTTTVIAHNGDEGQIIRGKGALSFRIGDFYRGNDSEQMRLTAEGNLGIGLTHPQAKLDVDGMIRASQGIMFPDGTIQTTAAIAGSNGKDRGGQPPSGQGLGLRKQDRRSVGTPQGQNTVSPEFMVNEDLTVNGSIFFTTGSPRDIAMLNNTGGVRIYSAPTLTNSPASAAIQFFGTGSAFTGQAYIDSGAHDNAAVIFRTAGTGGTIAERMRIAATGFVGIGRSTRVNVSEVFGVQSSFGGTAFGGMYMKTDSATGKPFYGYSLNGEVSAYHYVDGNDGGKWKLSVGNGNDVLTATPDGNVGIGASTPNTKLEVRGDVYLNNNGGTNLFLDATSVAGGRKWRWIAGTASQSYGVGNGFGLFDDTAGAYRLAVDVSGNVSIGTTSPTATKLQVYSDAGTGVTVTETSSGGIGVYGSNGSGLGTGVWGNSSVGRGVFGYSTSGVGVVAESLSGNTIMEGYSSGIRKFHIDNNGTYNGGSDFAEALPAYGKKASYQPGDVLVVSAKSPGTVEKSSRPYDQRLVGVYSTRPGVLGADKAGTSRVDPDELPVAIVGIVPTKVSTENGPVQAGDLLTSSSTVGYAMKASPVRVGRAKIYRPGTILGKALEPLEEGKGVIKVLVTLR